jgi:hypothetical protein
MAALYSITTTWGEELDDIALLDRWMSEIRRDASPDLPADVSRLIMEGRRRLGVIHLWRVYDVETVAAAVGISAEMRRALEATAGVEDAALAARLAPALDVPTTWIDV